MKKLFSIIAFCISILVLVALGILTSDMIKEYNYISSLPSTSGVDYLGFLIYPVLYCGVAVLGIITTAVCLKIATGKVLKIICGILLAIFLVVFVGSGIAWFGFI